MKTIEEILMLIGFFAVMAVVFYGLVLLIGEIFCAIEAHRLKKQDALRELMYQIHRMRPAPGSTLNPPSANLRKAVQEVYGITNTDGLTTESLIRAIIVKELKGGQE